MDHLHVCFARHRPVLLALGAAGALTFGLTLAVAPQRAWASLLLGNIYFLWLALFGTAFIAMNYIFSAGWAVAFRRVPEAMSAYLPIGFGFMVAIFIFGGRQLYPWLQPEVMAHDELVHHKAPYLNLPFLLARMVLAFALWIIFSDRLRRRSRQQDVDGDIEHTRINQRLSAGFLVAFAVTLTFASFDWIMSLQPKWFSTLFPGYILASILLGGAAAMSLLVIRLSQSGTLEGITGHHLNELARLLCAGSTFWAYLWFCQYMLIYYANIPEEAVYYAAWRHGPWALLFPLNLVVSWLIPVAALIPAGARRSPRRLFQVCVVILVGRWLDLYLMIVPGLGQPMHLGLPEILIPLGFAPLFLLPLVRTLRSGGLVPKKDPYLVESIHLEA